MHCGAKCRRLVERVKSGDVLSFQAKKGGEILVSGVGGGVDESKAK